MADENTLAPEDAARFSNAAAATQADAKYVANFNGDEIDGKTYQMGDPIAPSLDAGTAAYLTQIGRITAVSPDAVGVPSGGSNDGLTPPPRAGAPDSRAAASPADQLVADNSKGDLLKMAEAEGADVSDSDSKATIAAAIVAKREG